MQQRCWSGRADKRADEAIHDAPVMGPLDSSPCSSEEGVLCQMSLV